MECTIAELHDALITRARTVLAGVSPETYIYKHSFPITAPTFRRFLLRGSIRTDTLEKIEIWVREQEGKDAAIPPHV